MNQDTIDVMFRFMDNRTLGRVSRSCKLFHRVSIRHLIQRKRMWECHKLCGTTVNKIKIKIKKRYRIIPYISVGSTAALQIQKMLHNRETIQKLGSMVGSLSFQDVIVHMCEGRWHRTPAVDYMFYYLIQEEDSQGIDTSKLCDSCRFIL